MYTVSTGITHPEELAQITAWNGKAYATAWGGPTCNAINGTQGDIFSPYLTKDGTISVFSTDICRCAGALRPGCSWAPAVGRPGRLDGLYQSERRDLTATYACAGP